MKKMFTTIALTAVLVTGFLFVQEPTDLASELEPTIFSVEQPSLFF